MNNENLAIGILTVTATILLVGLLLIGTVGQEAKAGSQHDRGGDYIMLASQWRGERELLWVLDGRSEALGVYYFEPQRARLELVGVEYLGQGR